MHLQVNGVKINWSKEGDMHADSIPYYLKNIARVTLNAGDKVNLFNYQSNNPIEKWAVTISLKGFRVNQNN